MTSFFLSNWTTPHLGGSWICDSKVHTAKWVNNFPYTFQLRQALNWIGVDKGGVGDVWFFVYRISDHMPITFLAWDHYADPTGMHMFLHTWPGSKDIAVGDGLLVEYFGTPVDKKAQIICLMEYEYDEKHDE